MEKACGHVFVHRAFRRTAELKSSLGTARTVLIAQVHNQL